MATSSALCESVASQGVICNGEHIAPICDDPQCWHRIGTESNDIRLTLIWRRLREVLITAITELTLPTDEQNILLVFIAEHWGSHAPRQHEFHALEHRMRQCEKTIEGMRQALHDLRIADIERKKQDDLLLSGER